MKFKYILIYLFILSLISACSVNSHLKKGIGSFSIYNYFDAKKHFDKIANKNFEASYYLAKLYYKNDNPFHDLKKSYYSITKSDSLLELAIDLKKGLKITDSAEWREKILTLKNEIATAEYIHVTIIDQKELYQQFIEQFPLASEKESAILRRDQLALEETYKIGTAEAFKNFIIIYPNSTYVDEAKRQYEKKLYDEKTIRKSILSFRQFIQNYPNSPYKDEAEDEIYKIETEYGTLASYESFVKNYPDNHNTEAAWSKIYSLFMKNSYTLENLEKFAKKYPDYPFKSELKENLILIDKYLLPFELNNKWGYIDTAGKIIITPSFDWIENFYEGIALVGKGEKTGYINKQGNWILSGIDDGTRFSGGVAVVEKDEKYGVIDRGGTYILNAEYEDIGQNFDDLFYVLQNEKYGYANNNGVLVISPRFDDATDFENNMAKVKMEGKWGVIDKNGSFLIRPKYDALFPFNDKYYIAEYEGYKGVLSVEEDTIINFEYEEIYQESEGLSLVQKDGEVGYYSIAMKKIVIDYQYEPYSSMQTLGAFKNGHAAVKVKDKLGFINTKNKKVIPSIFQQVGYFSDRIPIIKNDLWGYCDEEADLKIDYQYDFAENFEDNNAIVQIDPFYGVIDKEGEELLAIQYEMIERIQTNTFIIKDKGRYGVVNLSGTNIIKPIYSKYVKINDRFIRFENNDGFVYFDTQLFDLIQLR